MFIIIFYYIITFTFLLICLSIYLLLMLFDA